MAKREEKEDDASVAAAQWLLALEEAPDDADLRAHFDRWLTASPAHGVAWTATVEVDDMIGSPAYAMYRTARDTAASSPRSVATIPRGVFRRRPALLAAATLALAACLALIALPGALLRWQADHVTTVAESRAVMLQDGSTVWLAPDSAIAVAAGGDRSIRLLRGGALFDVMPDPSRPFRVVAGGAEATVLGTVFDVRLLSEGTVIAVEEGAVRVSLRDTGQTLSPRLEAGHWMRVDRDGRRTGGTMALAEVAAWRKGQVVARDRTIGDVVEEVRRSFDGMIVVTDALARQRVTGVYNLDDPAAALRAMAGVHGGRVREISPWLLIMSGG